MSRTLIHIVSDQRMQNLLPILAIRPERVIQICSRGKKYLEIANHLEVATRESGIHAEFQVQELSSSIPDVAETRTGFKQLLDLFPDACVNLTGGTKLMFLGAIQAASGFDVPLLYCDTARKLFVHMGGKSFPCELSFGNAMDRLSLSAMMAAHGVKPGSWGFQPANEKMLEFGRKAYHLRWRHEEEFRNAEFSKRIREFYRCENGDVPAGKARLTALSDSNLLEEFSEPVPSRVIEYLDAALEAGLLARFGNKGYMLPACPEGKGMRSFVRTISNVLDGSWFELTVLDRVYRSSRFKDAHWSVQPSCGGVDERHAFGETDVVCISTENAAMVVISCKTSVPQPLEHLEALRERANNLGGRYAQATLAVLQARPELITELRRWGKLLSVKILVSDEVANYFDQY
jgi:hypothetical protein